MMMHVEAPSIPHRRSASIEIYTQPSTDLTINDLRRMQPISMQIAESGANASDSARGGASRVGANFGVHYGTRGDKF